MYLYLHILVFAYPVRWIWVDIWAHLLAVLPLVVGVVCPNHFESLTIHNLYAWPNFFSSIRRNSVNFDSLKLLETWAPNVSLQGMLEVLHVALLWGLRNSSPCLEPFPAVVSYGINKIVCKPRINKETRNGGARSSLAGVAVNDDHVIVVLDEFFPHVFTTLK